ncbi:MAG: hypothetical protein M3P24_03395 [Gemmatimonadota bacterium]|nr:hypothetical protein [Gemmatimonadota bacterium]
MKFPLRLTFKKIAIAPQLSVTDAEGTLQLYVRQKLFKLKESVTVFADREQTRPLYSINADRVLDFTARYTFTDQAGRVLGGVRRQGMRSLWRARYEVFRGEEVALHIQEENPWVKVLDGIVGDIPVLGLLSGYLLHPSYVVSRPDGAPVLRLTKEPALFEGKFAIEKRAELEPHEEGLAVLALLMMTLLERDRG